jgi:tRNA threonylcarbamoyladenosine biosynthesis protein TsaB
MGYYLHIDTSTDQGIVLLGKDGQLVNVRANTVTRNHAATINLMIDEVLAEARARIMDLEKVVVCAGPGSYTGLRIGMATAKGLCYALDIPLILHSRLLLLAMQAWRNTSGRFQYYACLLLAREKEYFLALYDSQFEIVIDAEHCNESRLAELLSKYNNICLVTDVGEIYQDLVQNGVFLIVSDLIIDTNFWTKMAIEALDCNNNVKISIAEPFYLKQVYTHN